MLHRIELFTSLIAQKRSYYLVTDWYFPCLVFAKSLMDSHMVTMGSCVLVWLKFMPWSISNILIIYFPCFVTSHSLCSARRCLVSSSICPIKREKTCFISFLILSIFDRCLSSFFPYLISSPLTLLGLVGVISYGSSGVMSSISSWILAHMGHSWCPRSFYSFHRCVVCDDLCRAIGSSFEDMAD